MMERCEQTVMDVTSTYGFGDKFVEMTSTNDLEFSSTDIGVYVDIRGFIVDMY